MTFAAPIRAAYPHLEIHGPQTWGWCAWFNSGVQDRQCTEGDDRRAHGDVPLTQWIMQKLVEYHEATGVLLLTHIDLHAYPQGSGVDGSAEDEATAALRLRSTMMFYNESYVDESWISQPIALLPRLRGWMASAGAGALGIKFAISEFNFGADSLVTAGVAHVETLAIFAREGLDEANVWTAPAPGSASAQAWGMFLNYDGSGRPIAGSPVNASSTDTPTVGAYAFVEAGATLRVLLTGKTAPSAGAASVSLALAWPAGTPRGSITAHAYGFSSSSAKLARLADVTLPCGDGAAAAALQLPPWSATLLVMPWGKGACGVSGL